MWIVYREFDYGEDGFAYDVYGGSEDKQKAYEVFREVAHNLEMDTDRSMTLDWNYTKDIVGDLPITVPHFISDIFIYDREGSLYMAEATVDNPLHIKVM